MIGDVIMWVRLRSLGWRCWHRSFNRFWDAIAVAGGACNRSTWDREGYAGGFAHWRCGRRRGHGGRHRFINYVWAGPGERVVYDPLPVPSLAEAAAIRDAQVPYARLTQRRKMIDTLRRGRVRRRVAERALAERLAAAGG